MTRRKTAIAAGGAVLALAAGGVGIAQAVDGEDDSPDKPISGPALERAERAALDRVGGGKVTETETGDEEGYYEVEVTRPGGGQVDVHLNRDFKVTSTEEERDEGPDDE